MSGWIDRQTVRQIDSYIGKCIDILMMDRYIDT